MTYGGTFQVKPEEKRLMSVEMSAEQFIIGIHFLDGFTGQS
jgi:hypothetical protein